MSNQPTEFQRIVDEDTFEVVPHDAATPRTYIGVRALNPNGREDSVFTLDQLNGGVKRLQATVDENTATLNDWKALQQKVDQVIPQ